MAFKLVIELGKREAKGITIKESNPLVTLLIEGLLYITDLTPHLSVLPCLWFGGSSFVPGGPSTLPARNLLLSIQSLRDVH